MDTISSLNSQTLVILKLRDDGSNWADYEPHARRAMGSKGLVPHLEGHASKPMLYAEVNGIPHASPGVEATSDQIEAKEKRISDYKQREFLAQHCVISLISPWLAQTIMQLTTMKDMWDAVTADATTASMLHQIDVLNQLQMMRCPSSPDAKVHLAKVKAHFTLMTERYEYLHVTKSPVHNSIYIMIIISSMPEIFEVIDTKEDLGGDMCGEVGNLHLVRQLG